MSALLQKRNERGQLFDDRKKLTLKKQKIEDDLELANTDLEIPENEDYETLEDVSIPEPGNFTEHYTEIIINIPHSLKWQIGLILLIAKSQLLLMLH